MTFLSSGIRLNELLQLKIGDIDTERQIIHVVGKGRKGAKTRRTINLLGLSILRNYIRFTFQAQIATFTEEQLDGLHVFSTDGGISAMSARTIQYIVKNLIKMATSIPKNMKSQYSVHTFRHCYAVYGLESGIDIYTLSKLLGHESIETTTIYLKLFEDQLKKAVEKHPFANGLNKGIQMRVLLDSHYYQLWENHCNLRAKSKENYMYELQKFEAFLLNEGFTGVLDFDKFFHYKDTDQYSPINQKFIDSYFDCLKNKGYTNSVLSSNVSALKTFLKFLKA